MTILLAISAWAGATAAHWWPATVLLGAAGVAACRRPDGRRLAGSLAAAAGIAGVVALAAARSLSGLSPPEPTSVRAWAELVSDPDLEPGSVRVEVRLPGGSRYLAQASAAAADVLATRSSGDLVLVRGAIEAWRQPMAWAQARHLRGRLRVEHVQAARPGSPAARAANTVRALLDDGAATLDQRDRALLAGLVFGDDRAQPPALVADFRASGLTHLLAVSGQNVAFVMVIAGPALRRLTLWPRLVAAVSVIVAFAFLTRFEPSVLRASAVAVLAIGRGTVGSPLDGVRVLAGAVVVLLVVDPLLVHSLGFQLSVAATSGVLLIAPRIDSTLPGPTWFRAALSVTAGAQLAVAPVLIPAVGDMPLSAIPANVAAAPVAGALMVWGVSAGLVAGILPTELAAVVHLPTRIGLRWLTGVAETAASLPLGRIGLPAVVALSCIALAIAVVRALDVRLARPLVLVAGATGLFVAGQSVLWGQPSVTAARAGFAATVWVDDGVAVVDLAARASAERVLDTLRAEHVRVVAVVVVRSSRPELADVVAAIESRWEILAVVGPSDVHPRAVTPTMASEFRVRNIRVVVAEPGPPLAVRIGRVRVG